VVGVEPTLSFEQQGYNLSQLSNFAALTFYKTAAGVCNHRQGYEDEERFELSTLPLTTERSAIELFIHFVFCLNVDFKRIKKVKCILLYQSC
jgi:hypothetical protein